MIPQQLHVDKIWAMNDKTQSNNGRNNQEHENWSRNGTTIYYYGTIISFTDENIKSQFKVKLADFSFFAPSALMG